MSNYKTTEEYKIKQNLTKSQLEDYTKKKDNIYKLRDRLLTACKMGHLAREDGNLSNHLENIEDLILKGASVNHVDVDGNTALHLACIHEEIEVVQLLLKYDPDLSIKNHDQPDTELAIVCNPCGVKKYDPDLIIKNHGQTAVEVAVEYAAPMDMIRMLIKSEDK